MPDPESRFVQRPLRMTLWSGRRGRIRIEIDENRVHVTERSLRMAHHWSEPLSGYVGVQLNSTIEPGSQLGARRWHEAVLRHRDPRKTIPLFGSQRLADVRRVWKEAAAAFAMPAVERTPVGYIARHTDDLDKPYGDLVKRRLTDRLVAPLRAPLSIDCRRQGPVTRAMLRLHGLEVVPAMLLMTLGVAFLVLGSGLGIGLGIAGALLLLFGVNARRGIEVTPEGVACSWMTPFGDFRRRTIPFKELHTVTWTGADSSPRRNAALLLASDRTEITLDNLPRSQADWLGRLVLSAALGAEPRLGLPGTPVQSGLTGILPVSDLGAREYS